MRGIDIARSLALMGAETVIATPKDRLPFDENGPAINADRWQELGRRMQNHELSAEPTLVRLRDKLSLSPLDYWLVMLCGAAERYPEVAVALGIMMDQSHAYLVTPLAFAQLMNSAQGVPIDDALCSAMSGGSAARLGLVEVAESSIGKPLSHQTIRLAPEELSLLLSQLPFHGRQEGPAKRKVYAPAFDEMLLRVGASLIEQCRIICLRGPSPRSLRQFAADLAGWFELDTHIVSIGQGAPNLTQLLRIHDALPVLDLTTSEVSAAQWRTALSDVPNNIRLAVLAGENFQESDIASIMVPRLGWREAERIWRAVTGEATLARELATRFRVTEAEADAACRHAFQVAAVLPSAAFTSRKQLIAAQVLDQGAQRMGKLVTLLKSEASLADLVVSDFLRSQLIDIVDWQRNTARVFGEMGLGRHTPLGRGLTCLFSGPPGTGKTFAAQCLANELGLNLYRIDLSQVVSKYIGETEKALATVFDEAEAGHGVLLFDEADALFGKRSEVRDAHDRYANIEVGYLLQRIEAYEGVAILATNLRSNMDPAFIRRIRFMLDFPMPDVSMRERLWEQSLPGPNFRAENLDLDLFVKRFRLSGGSIQNISLAAAHMAAATSGGRILMEHLVRATYRELEKSGQSHDRANFGPLADHLPAEVA